MDYVKITGNVSITYSQNATAILGKDYWYLPNDIRYEIVIGDDTYNILIERGFLTDGATVPRILWSLFPLWTNYTAAVILHDYMCNYGIVMKNGSYTTLNRSNVDKIFLKVMQFHKVSRIKYWIMYAAVRLHAITTGRYRPFIGRTKALMEQHIKGDIDNPPGRYT